MTLLACAFFFRVMAQLVQFTYPVSFLPAYGEWHGDVLPYTGLLLSQGIILTAMGLFVRRVRLGLLTATLAKQRFWLGFGLIYAGVMAFRLAAGLTFWSDRAWFAAYLPVTFHLVLAAFVILVGCYFRQVRRSSFFTSCDLRADKHKHLFG